MWRFVRYWLYVGHRWLGIFACLLFVIWFVSGVVMTCVGYPTLDRQARIRGLTPIDWTAVRITPDALLALLPFDRYPSELSLEMLRGEPVYRIVDWDGLRRTVSAVKPENVRPVDRAEAALIASAYAGGNGAWRETLMRDQWTVAEGFNRSRPLHRIAIGDNDGTEVYVSAPTGEVVLATTRTQRFWNWLGSVPHWIYFTKLRTNQPVWRQVNLWISGPAILIAVSGIWIGILRLHVRRRYPSGQVSPYHGWKLWHHWAGILGGIFLLTWIVSGWLSVNPNRWLSGNGPAPDALLHYAGHVGLSFDADLDRLRARVPTDVKHARFFYTDGTPIVELSRGEGDRVLLDAAGASLELNDRRLFDAARRFMPKHPVVAEERLTADDLYWYSHHERRPLPVLRVRFADPENSWFYLDPYTGEVLDFMDDGGRRYRWWFNALHRLDFAWLLQYPLLWRMLMWTFCAAGLIVSASGVVIGWRRVRRKF